MGRWIYGNEHPYDKAHQLAAQGDYTVITSSQLAARALSARHQSLRSLAVKCLENQGWRVASPLMAQALFRQVLQDTLQPADLLGMARSWMPAVQSILQSCAGFAASPAVSPRTQQILQIAQQYRAALHQRQLVDVGEVFWRAAELQPQPQQILVYGYFQPQPDELAWINAIATSHSAFFLPCPSQALFTDSQAALNWLLQQGWERVPDPTPAGTPGETLGQIFLGVSASPPQTAAAHGYSTAEAEIRGTLAQVKELLLLGVPARDIAVVARDETAYGPKLIDIAWEYGVPLRALYDTPFLSTRLGGWLSLLLEVIEAGFPFEATAKLLSHPLASNPDGEFWSAVRSRHPRGVEQWGAIAKDLLDLDLTLLSQTYQPQRRDVWVEWWQSLFVAFDLRRRCARWARESLAFNRLRAGLVELSRPEAEELSWPELRQQFTDLLVSLSVPAQPGRGGVELHRPTSVMGARYAHVFVIGMTEGTLPAPISNDPVLDFFERQQLQAHGIPLAAAAALARREALAFYYLLQTVTEQVTFSYARLKERQAQLASPYLDRLALTVEPPPALPVASPEALRRILLRQSLPTEDAVLTRTAHAFAVEQHRESSQPADEYDGVIGIPFDYADWPFSVSQLRNLGQCPFKWFANKVLRLGPLEEAEDDLSSSQLGTFYHRVLELIGVEIQRDPFVDLTRPELLEEAFAAAEQELMPADSPVWGFRRQEHLRSLSLVLQHPDFLAAGAIPVVLEGAFEGEWHGLKVRGRVDRIDQTAAGLVLIDYKTGSSRPPGIKDKTGKACIDLQLPLYQEVAGPALCPDSTVAAAYYYSLRGRKKIPISTTAPQHELPDAIERCKEHLHQGSYPVQPDNARAACQYCDFDALCRQGNRLSRKENSNGTD
ncbi:PD-(D/E)XK nuclease family protein [Pseudanabaena sp. FACHB-2040]|uniref:PD-(D/E)XK nuclease family protein n=1 Tax=Pseudanabaena sp. FACHB-2040 TaxID=2692859 RepID=UPI001683ABD1|nr:PD-(D/E)XK nuclease family protein [Pseudanabaena sp. FACHB-2040]MBD2256956.1 PD-(D/E)XK nuclease family protein [Pseudanabaena sp. FACHB-2040]